VRSQRKGRRRPAAVCPGSVHSDEGTSQPSGQGSRCRGNCTGKSASKGRRGFHSCAEGGTFPSHSSRGRDPCIVQCLFQSTGLVAVSWPRLNWAKGCTGFHSCAEGGTFSSHSCGGRTQSTVLLLQLRSQTHSMQKRSLALIWESVYTAPYCCTCMRPGGSGMSLHVASACALCC